MDWNQIKTFLVSLLSSLFSLLLSNPFFSLLMHSSFSSFHSSILFFVLIFFHIFSRCWAVWCGNPSVDKIGCRHPPETNRRWYVLSYIHTNVLKCLLLVFCSSRTGIFSLVFDRNNFDSLWLFFKSNFSCHIYSTENPICCIPNHYIDIILYILITLFSSSFLLSSLNYMLNYWNRQSIESGVIWYVRTCIRAYVKPCTVRFYIFIIYGFVHYVTLSFVK